MRQALHILAKDIRALRYEIALVLALAALFAWMEIRAMNAWWTEMLLTIAEAYLIVRVVHAEAILGENQFWVTRPYRWSSLFAAKFAFILLFVNVPVFVAQFSIVNAAGFPLDPILPGLLWSLLLTVVCFSAPVAALAAVTSGLTSFMLLALILLVIGFFLWQPGFWRTSFWPYQAQWVRNSAAVAAVAAAASVVLYMQYRRRRTLFSRVFAGGAAAIATAAWWPLPWPLAMDLHRALSKEPDVARTLRAGVNPDATLWYQRSGRTDNVHIGFAIDIRGAAEGVDLQGDALAVTLEAPDGRSWTSTRDGFAGLTRHTPASGEPEFHAGILVNRAFFESVRTSPLSVRGRLHLTLFGNERVSVLRSRDARAPVNVVVRPMAAMSPASSCDRMRSNRRIASCRASHSGCERSRYFSVTISRMGPTSCAMPPCTRTRLDWSCSRVLPDTTSCVSIV